MNWPRRSYLVNIFSIKSLNIARDREKKNRSNANRLIRMKTGHKRKLLHFIIVYPSVSNFPVIFLDIPLWMIFFVCLLGSQLTCTLWLKFFGHTIRPSRCRRFCIAATRNEFVCHKSKLHAFWQCAAMIRARELTKVREGNRHGFYLCHCSRRTTCRMDAFGILFGLSYTFLSFVPAHVFCLHALFIYSSNERNHLSAKFTTTCTAYWEGRITLLLKRWNGDCFFFILCRLHSFTRWRWKMNFGQS